mgnify:CR=1 FL=1|jgi:hypothetical protein|tara:strand:+ start:1443 stop:2258 length:816 start_codon:yes stop_codon:yes gene_type:complete
MNCKLALYCKTYKGDFKRVKRLLDSIEQWNEDDIPFFISCPKLEEGMLEDLIGDEGYTFISDEEIYKIKNQLGGWEDQMLIKLHAFDEIPADNILILDSDAYFIKPFYIKDFIAYDNIPYTIMYENKQMMEYETLLKGGDYNNTGYAKAVRAYRTIFGGKGDKIYDYGPNPHLWNREVIDSFKRTYLQVNNIKMEEFCLAMKSQYGIHFRETLTYGEYLHAVRPIPIIPCGPFFKVYHWKELYDFEVTNQWFDKDKISKNYNGIILQSNWT